MRITPDANVLVRAHPRSLSTARRVIVAVIEGGHTLILSNQIITETIAVLRYPRLQKRFALADEELYDYAGFLRQVSQNVILSQPYVAPLRDPDDLDVLQRQFESGSPEEVTQALVSAAFHEADWGWVQDWCIRLADHTDSNVRRVAIVSLGHIARVHRALDLGRVLPILALKAKEEDLEGTVEDALSDIHMFIPGCKR